MFRSLRTLRTIPRFKDIAFVLARHGFHQVAAYLQAPVSARLRRLFSSEAPPAIIHEPERLRLVFQDLGPTFIKFGQLLSTRPDLLPEPYIREFGKLQDEVDPAPREEILEVVARDLGSDLHTLFAEFSLDPIASASIGQVYRAVTPGGEEVVVKVRKRGVQRVIEQDLNILRFLVDVIGEWPFFRIHDLDGVLNVFERSIRRELDFTYEKNNLEQMRKHLRPDDPVRIPRVHEALCSRRVLTMELLPGCKLSAPGADDELSNGQGEALARRLAATIIRQIFEDGLFHADLHPGNLILMGNGRVGLIDFGNIGRCTPGMMDELLLLMYYLVRRDYALTARMVLKVGRAQTDVDVHELTYELMDSLDHYHGLSMRDIQVAGLLNSFFAISMRYQITLPPQYVLLARTLITLEGVVRTLAPEVEILTMIEPSLLKVVRARWAPARVYRELESTLTELGGSLRSAPVHLAEVLRRTAEGRLKIETNLRNTERLEQRLEFIGIRVPLAILAGATLIGSAMLLNQSFGAGGGTLQIALGACGFISSMALAFLIAMRH